MNRNEFARSGQGFQESDSEPFLDEIQNITLRSASGSETAEQAAVLAHMEGRRLIVVEWAACLESARRFLELDFGQAFDGCAQQQRDFKSAM